MEKCGFLRWDALFLPVKYYICASNPTILINFPTMNLANLANLQAKAKEYFHWKVENEEDIIREISDGVSFRGATLWILIFAIFIASLGLNVNSTAVIIGAMLVSPLMGPIIGMGLAVGIGDLELLKRAARNFGVATLISVLTAMVYFLLTPLSDARSELLARTTPTIYDVLIATCGGAAGFIALCTKGKGNVIPGVAIATALMPPLCTAGYGLATGHFLYFLGAFYLFFINTVFISLSTYVGVRLLHFHRKRLRTDAMERKTRRVALWLALFTILPSVFMTVGMIKDSLFDNNVNRFIKKELSGTGTQIISHEVNKDSLELKVVAVGREITAAKMADAERRMEDYGMKGYTLSVIQGEQSDSALMLLHELNAENKAMTEEKKQLLELSTRNNELHARLNNYTRYEQLAGEMGQELKALFPQVKRICLANVMEQRTDTALTCRYVAAMVEAAGNKKTGAEERKRLEAFLKARVKADSVVVIWR